MPTGACTDIPSKLQILIALESTDCPSPIADFAVASANQKDWLTVLEQGSNPLAATLTCNDGSGGPDLTLAITDPTGCIPASIALTINSMAPFDASGSATVDKQTCGCVGTGSVGLSVVVTGDAMPAGLKVPTVDVCAIELDGESGCCTESGDSGLCSSAGCITPDASSIPIRYAAGHRGGSDLRFGQSAQQV